MNIKGNKILTIGVGGTIVAIGLVVAAPLAFAVCGCLKQGRFTGGPNILDSNGIIYRAGLTLHCDGDEPENPPADLSNNLNITWQDANGVQNHFHLAEHLATILCSDTTGIIQAPPVAPLDTMIGEGVGSLNGVDGYSITFTLIDGGEPATKNAYPDNFGFTILDPSGDPVVVTGVQPLISGNLQAHYDQPHGSKP